MRGKTVIITGASRGIGADTARVFAGVGANVVLVARSANALRSLAQEIGAQALALPCDISDYAQVEAVVAATVVRFGGVDVLINNAGVIEPIAPLARTDPADWGGAIDINLKGVYHGMRAVLPLMQASGRGTILTVSSGAAHHPLEGWSAYCASKAGVAMLTRCAHEEAAQQGLRVMGLSPGTVATDMQRKIKKSGINPVSQIDWTDHIPPDWPARALLWMCGAAADDWLGQEISLRDPDIRQRVGLA